MGARKTKAAVEAEHAELVRQVRRLIEHWLRCGRDAFKEAAYHRTLDSDPLDLRSNTFYYERRAEEHLRRALELAEDTGFVDGYPDLVWFAAWEAERRKISDARWRGPAYGLVQPMSRAA